MEVINSNVKLCKYKWYKSMKIWKYDTVRKGKVTTENISQRKNRYKSKLIEMLISSL